MIPNAVKNRHYGCGCPIPDDDLSGITVLDLGSGAGVDAFIASHKVGPSGFVHGIDMTNEQLAVANKHADEVADAFGFPARNTAFHKDFIEVADSIPDDSVDLVISDCVINLSPRKDLVFQTIQRVLKEGGEFYISDIAADREVPDSIRKDPEMIAECLGGAMYEHAWFDTMKDAGVHGSARVQPPCCSDRGERRADYVLIANGQGIQVRQRARPALRGLRQVAVYKGNSPDAAARFVFDDHHIFEAHRPTAVCRNTARMISETRLGRYFEVTPAVKHFGLFPCGRSRPAANRLSPAADKWRCNG